MEDNSNIKIILVVILLLVIAVIVSLLVFVKPPGKSFDKQVDKVKNTPQEQIESLDPLIKRVHNLTGENLLFDQLFDVLVYSENPDVNLIGDFVSRYQNFAGKYTVDGTKPGYSDSYNESVDTTVISFGLQQHYLKNSIDKLIESTIKRQKVFRTIPVTYPMNKEEANIVSGYGMRDHPILEKRIMHNGIDIAAPVGTEVKATANGKVISTEEKYGGYGFSVLVEHRFGYQTLYGHMVRIVVRKDTWVQKGDVVGIVGNTGLSVAPHLHYEVRKNGKPLNPSYFIFEGLNKDEYKDVIALGSKTNEILSF
jgi:murein DD-endopeptidase MepM/ murein hydrolase activator NlpD